MSALKPGERPIVSDDVEEVLKAFGWKQHGKDLVRVIHGARITLDKVTLASLAQSLERGRNSVLYLTACHENERRAVDANRQQRWRAAQRHEGVPTPVRGGSRFDVQARQAGIAAIVGTLSGLFPNAVVVKDGGIGISAAVVGPKGDLAAAVARLLPLLVVGKAPEVHAEAVARDLARLGLASRIARPPPPRQRWRGPWTWRRKAVLKQWRLSNTLRVLPT